MSERTNQPSPDNLEGFTISRYHCRDCSQTFQRRETILSHRWCEHIDQDSLPATFRCGTCDTDHNTQDELQEHQEKEHLPIEFPWKCSRCSRQFDTRENAVSHFWDTHIPETSLIETRIECPDCDWTGNSSREFLLEHYDPDHNTELLSAETPSDSTCPACDNELANERGMLQHVADKHDIDLPNTPYCAVCDDQVATISDAITHVQETHAPDVDGVTVATKTCPDCSTDTYHNLTDHYKRTHLTNRVACPECDKKCSGRNPVDRIRKHYWGTHTERDTGWEIESQATVDRDTTLECLYNINKHAKKYAELGTDNYQNGKKTTAKANSLKKGALYELKERILEQIYQEADQINLHTIDGNQFYLFDFNDFSFHTPIENFSLPDDKIDTTDTLEDFAPGSNKEHSDKSLKESLLFFEREFGFNANEFLDRKFLSYGHNSYFIGWKYLGENNQ